MGTNTGRRGFLKDAAAAAAGAALASACGASRSGVPDRAAPARVIDTHTHFYDPSRPQGVPWPPKNDALLYRTVLPRDYKTLPMPRPAGATVVVEASVWVEDNQWILDLAKDDPFLAGLVGNLPVGTEPFPAQLARFAANPRFRGVRVHEPDFKARNAQPAFADHLRLLAGRGLSLDVNVGTGCLPDVARLAREVPDLRIVIDHVANVRIDGKTPPDAWRKGIADTAACPRVYCKVSGLVEGSGRSGGKAPRDAAFYRGILDAVWEAFGEDRLLFGTNWPVCAIYATAETVQQIILDYVGPKGAGALEKVLGRNATTAYGCA